MATFNQPKISTLISENTSFLQSLARTRSNRKRKRILKNASSDQLLALAEICLNIVKSRFKLTARQKKRLIPFAEFVRQMSRARSERGARKLIQKGEGAGAVFTALITPILIELAKSVIKGKTKNQNSSESANGE